MTARLRAALVGCGRIGARTRPELRERLGSNWLPLSHAEAIAATPEFAFAACCDADPGAARETAGRYNVPSVFTDYRELLKAARPDLLCVATRGDVRPDILSAAADAGVRAVHCEKPLGLSVSAAEIACRALAMKNVGFSFGALRHYMPVFRRARDLALSGELGELQSLTVQFGRSGLLWTHPHSIGLLCMFAGGSPVRYVQANLAIEQDEAKPGLIDCDPVVLSATIEFANGVVGHIVDQGGLSMEIAGTRGGLAVIGDGSWLVRKDLSIGLASDPTKNWRFDRDDSRLSGRLLALHELREFLLRDTPPSLTAAEALHQHRILFALVQSHLEGGRRVTIDDVDPALVVTGRTGDKLA